MACIVNKVYWRSSAYTVSAVQTTTAVKTTSKVIGKRGKQQMCVHSFAATARLRLEMFL